MVESYKTKSKIATAAAFIAGLIVYLGQDQIASVIPVEYANWVPIIVLIAGYILAQSTENKRVEIAEQLQLEKIAKNETQEIEQIDPASDYEAEE